MDTRKFSIMAFGSILGTGGFALASKAFLPFLVIPLTWVLVFFFLLFSAILLVKLVLHPGIVKTELKHTLLGNFYALQPISAVILAILCWNIIPSFIDLGLLVYGAGLILALAIYLPYHFFSNIKIKLDQMHGGWFITPVATILVTNAVLLYPVSAVTMIFALFFFGIGTMLFLLILGMLFFRLVSHTLPTVELAPTNYILLAPIGILIVDFIKISNSAGILLKMNLSPLGALGGAALWGFGIWAIGVNLLFFRKYLKSGFQFNLGWWSYVFPTAAFTLGTASLSDFFSTFKTISLFLYVCLTVVFIIVLLGSLKQMLNPKKGRFVSGAS